MAGVQAGASAVLLKWLQQDVRAEIDDNRPGCPSAAGGSVALYIPASQVRFADGRRPVPGSGEQQEGVPVREADGEAAISVYQGWLCAPPMAEGATMADSHDIDVFFSNDHNDRERVRPLVEDVRRNGWAVWWDTGIRIGSVWRDVLTNRCTAHNGWSTRDPHFMPAWALPTSASTGHGSRAGSSLPGRGGSPAVGPLICRSVV